MQLPEFPGRNNRGEDLVKKCKRTLGIMGVLCAYADADTDSFLISFVCRTGIKIQHCIAFLPSSDTSRNIPICLRDN